MPKNNEVKIGAVADISNKPVLGLAAFTRFLNGLDSNEPDKLVDDSWIKPKDMDYMRAKLKLLTLHKGDQSDELKKDEPAYSRVIRADLSVFEEMAKTGDFSDQCLQKRIASKPELGTICTDIRDDLRRFSRVVNGFEQADNAVQAVNAFKELSQELDKTEVTPAFRHAAAILAKYFSDQSKRAKENLDELDQKYATYNNLSNRERKEWQTKEQGYFKQFAGTTEQLSNKFELLSLDTLTKERLSHFQLKFAIPVLVCRWRSKTAGIWRLLQNVQINSQPNRMLVAELKLV